VQAGLVLAGERSQSLRRSGIETRLETMISGFCGDGAREIERSFVKRRVGLAGQEVPPIAGVHPAVRSGQIGFLAGSGLREIAGEWRKILATEQRVQLPHDDPDRAAIAHGVMQGQPEQVFAGVRHFDQSRSP